MHFLGIDGGGTKTTFLLIDEKGNIISRAMLSTCNIKQIGPKSFKKKLEKGIDKICTKANLTINDINHTFLGLSGYGENKEDITRMEKVAEEILGNNKFTCGNDVEAGWAGSLACNPGVNIVLGTGSIAYGVNPDGDNARSSGWGHICGDEGSAYWIAKKGIEVFTKQSDHRFEKTLMYDLLKKELNISKDFDIIKLITNDFKGDRTKIASIAKHIYSAAIENDKFAIEIFRLAAYEAFLMAMSVISQLNFNPENDEIIVSYSGSVFDSGSLILDPLKQFFKINNIKISLQKPLLTPDKGAALYALKLYGETISNDLIEVLKVS